jgi:fatty-acid desaturase
MRSYNLFGYSVIAFHILVSAIFSPPEWSILSAVTAGVLYLTFIWFFGGVYASNILHMGIAHSALDFKDWFIKFMTVFYNTAGIYINPVSWVNRHRHHHAFSDHEGDPNKLAGDGFWKTLYLCFFPYQCKRNLAQDKILKSLTFRLVANPYFALFSHFSSFGLIWLVAGDWQYALALWLSVRIFALWVNMLQNYWTHDRRFGTRRYDDEDDNAMNLDEWLPVTASFSACLQNNHHHYPNFLRTSHDQREYDFGFLTVRAMRVLGLVEASSSGIKKPKEIALQEIGF